MKRSFLKDRMSKYHHSIKITKRIIYSIITKNNHWNKECWIPVLRHTRSNYVIVRLPLLVEIVNVFPVPYRTTQRCALLRPLWKLIMDMTTRIRYPYLISSELPWYVFNFIFYVVRGARNFILSSIHRSTKNELYCVSNTGKSFSQFPFKTDYFDMKTLVYRRQLSFLSLSTCALTTRSLCIFPGWTCTLCPGHRNNIQFRFKMKYLLPNLYFQNWYQQQIFQTYMYFEQDIILSL